MFGFGIITYNITTKTSNRQIHFEGGKDLILNFI